MMFWPLPMERLVGGTSGVKFGAPAEAAGSRPRHRRTHRTGRTRTHARNECIVIYHGWSTRRRACDRPLTTAAGTVLYVTPSSPCQPQQLQRDRQISERHVRRQACDAQERTWRDNDCLHEFVLCFCLTPPPCHTPCLTPTMSAGSQILCDLGGPCHSAESERMDQ